MSNFSTFFPSAGGGGGSLVSYDPLTLNRVNADELLFVSKYVQSAFLPSTHNYFWQSMTNATYGSLYGQVGAAIDMTTSSNAFQTIVDITNTGKGGKLICVVGPCVEVNVVVTFKITIDGTATEIEYTNLQGFRMRGALGGILAGRPDTTSTTSGLTASPFDGKYYHSRSSTGGASNSNGFASGDVGNYWSLPTVFDGINQIQFKDTCKVEVKANMTDTASNRNKAGVIVVPN
jgi:hypothetical protein